MGMESFPYVELEVTTWIVNGLVMPARHKKYKYLHVTFLFLLWEFLVIKSRKIHHPLLKFSDINRLNEGRHVTGHIDDKSLHREPWQGVRYAEPFTIKITWLKARLIQLPADAAPDVLWHYAHYYMLRLIGGLPMTDKSSGIVHARWIPLIVDFERCMQYSWGSPMLAGPTTLYAWLSMGDLA
ncbi:hypothetical protein HN873_052548 [Arachis hypogaea]